MSALLTCSCPHPPRHNQARCPQCGGMPVRQRLWPWLVPPMAFFLVLVGSALVTLLIYRKPAEEPTTEPEPPVEVVEISDPELLPEPTVLAEAAVVPVADNTLPSVVPVPPILRSTRTGGPPPDLEVATAAPSMESGKSRLTRLPPISDALLMLPRPDTTSPRDIARANQLGEQLFDFTVDRFILYDLGQLQGFQGQQALREFERLGPSALPALTRGVNKALTIEASCPISVLTAKVRQLVLGIADLELLGEVREQLGRGVGPTRHKALLNELRKALDTRLRDLKEGPRPRIPTLVTALRSHEAPVRRKAANTFAFLGADAKPAIPHLLEALRDPDGEVRGYAARALTAIGPDAAPYLRKAARNPLRDVRMLALLALGEIRPVDPETPPVLIAALEDGETDVRVAARSALVSVGDVAVPDLREALEARNVQAALVLGDLGLAIAIPDLITTLKDDSQPLRVAAHHALVRIGAPAVPALVKALPRAESREWYSITVALGKIGPGAKAAVPVLTTALKHEDPSLRILAAQALVRIEPENAAVKPILAEAVPAFVALVKDDRSPLRAWAAQSLGQLDTAAPTAVPALLAILSDADPIVSSASREALNRLGKAAVPTLLRKLDHADPVLRAASREGLIHVGRPAVTDLITLLKDERPALRRLAAEILTRIGSEAHSATPALCAALQDRIAEVREAAATALRDVAPPGAENVPSALAAALSDADARVRLAAHLSLVPRGRSAAEALVPLLANAPVTARRLATETLKKMGPAAAAAAPDLLLATRDADEEVRAGAGWALEAIALEFRTVLPALRQPPTPAPAVAIPPPARPLIFWTTDELLAALEKGQKEPLKELSLRNGEAPLLALARRVLAKDEPTRTEGRTLLIANLIGRPEDKAESEAARRLKLDLEFFGQGKPDKARERLEALVAAHPRTRAAEQARRHLARPGS